MQIFKIFHFWDEFSMKKPHFVSKKLESRGDNFMTTKKNIQIFIGFITKKKKKKKKKQQLDCLKHRLQWNYLKDRRNIVSDIHFTQFVSETKKDSDGERNVEREREKHSKSYDHAMKLLSNLYYNITKGYLKWRFISGNKVITLKE